MRRKMMDCFNESAIERMSDTIKGLSDGIVQDTTILANVLATPQHIHIPQQPPTSPPVQPNYQISNQVNICSSLEVLSAYTSICIVSFIFKAYT